MPSEGLKNKTLKGVGWSATDNLLQHGISFVIGLILARILSPSEYGLIGLAMTVIAIMSSFVNAGFSNALIRKLDVSEADYSTMFIFNMVASVFAYAIIYFISPYASKFLNVDITLLIRILGLSVVINAFAVVQDTHLSKNINFKLPAIATFVSVIIGGLVGVICAYNGFGVWALVVQQLLSALVRVIVLWVLNPWHPKLQFNRDSMNYIWSFGWKMLLVSVLNQIWNQIYVIFVGKVYSPATLGQYSRARHYGQFFSSNLNDVVRKVTFPALSSIQDRPSYMVDIYRRIIKVTMLITTVCMFGLGAVAEPLIYCLIGDKWSEAASYLPYMCVYMSLFPLNSINLNMLMIQNRSDIYLYLDIIRKVVALLPIAVGVFWGIKWLLVCTILTAWINYFLNSYFSGKKLNYSSWRQLKDVMPEFIIAIIVAVSMYFFKYLPITYFVILPVQLFVGLIVFFAICEMLKLPEYLEIKMIAISVIHKSSHMLSSK